jgi:hypothetical protein
LKDEKLKLFLNKTGTGTVHGRFAKPIFDGTDDSNPAFESLPDLEPEFWF